MDDSAIVQSILFNAGSIFVPTDPALDKEEFEASIERLVSIQKHLDELVTNPKIEPEFLDHLAEIGIDPFIWLDDLYWTLENQQVFPL